jgi:hypothetical protein
MVNETISNITSIANDSLSQQIPITSIAPSYSRILPWFPDIVTFVLFGAILLIIYVWILPKEMRAPVKKVVGKFWFPLLLIVLWLYFRKRWGMIYEIPSRWPANMYFATFIFGLILILYLIVVYLMYYQRYMTYHAIANNRSGSCSYYDNIGDFTIFKIGTCGRTDKKIVIPYPVPKELWIIPRCAWRKVGGQMLLETKLFKSDLNDLPEEVKEHIDKDIFSRLAKDEIWFGLWSQKVRAADPKYSEIESMNKKLNDRINELNDMLKSKLKTVKGYINETFAMSDKVKGKTWKQPVQEQG